MKTICQICGATGTLVQKEQVTVTVQIQKSNGKHTDGTIKNCEQIRCKVCGKAVFTDETSKRFWENVRKIQ